MKSPVVRTIALLLVVSPVAAFAQDPSSLAQQRYLRALQLYDAREYTRALEELRGSYQLRASPNSRLLIARCLRELGRIPEAVTEFETTLHEAREHGSTDARYLDTERAAAAEMGELEPRIGRLRLTIVNAPSVLRVRLNALELPTSALALAIPVAPGRVNVSVLAEGLEPLSTSVDALAGMTRAVTLAYAVDSSARQRAALARSNDPISPQAAPSSGPWLLRGSGPLRGFVWASWSIGAASLLTAAALGAATQGAFVQLEQRCGGGPCPSAEILAIESGRALQLGTNLALAVGVTSAVVGTTLFLLAPRAATAPSAQRAVGTAPRRDRWAVVPVPAGLSFVREF